MTYISHIIRFVSIVHFFSFFAISLLELLKHVKLVAFENYNECKTKHLFLFKKVVTRFDKKISYSIGEENNLSLWKEDPISEDSKKTLSLRTLKRILSMRNLKRTLITVKTKDSAIHEDHQELQDPRWLLGRKLTLFGFLVMVYNRVDDGDKFLKKNFGLGRLRFYATNHLKNEAKVFFS